MKEKYYCGSELNDLGWPVDETEYNSLYYCTDGTDKELAETCTASCISRSTADSYCSCIPEERYCGWELEGSEHRNLSSDHIYKCGNDGSIEHITDCGDKECVINEAPKCKKPCTRDIYYCGSQLIDLGWEIEEVANNSLYLCVDGENIDDLGTCKALCIPDPISSFCGHRCKSGFPYCGSKLKEMGWMGVNVTDLYYCEDGKIKLEKTCTHSCIETKSFASCNDECENGTTVCGNQLHGVLKNVNERAVYQCANDTYEETYSCLNECKMMDGSPICVKECTDGKKYCGNQLERLEWTGMKSNGVYRCNGTGVELDQICKHECRNSICMRECENGLWYCGHKLQELGFQVRFSNRLYKCAPGNMTNAKYQICKGQCKSEDKKSFCSTENERECGTQSRSPASSFVRGGRESNDAAKWPWMVSIRKYSDDSISCGGTLIHPQWVLTAAHCLEDIEADNLTITTGDYQQYNIDQGEVTMKVAEIVRYPTYDNKNMRTGDIALLKLERVTNDSIFSSPVCLPNNGQTVSPSTKCTILGWGRNKDTASPNVLREGLINVFPDDKCGDFGKNGDASFSFNSSIMICAGQQDETTTVTCQGDSGGPLLCDNSDGTWTIHGITSYGYNRACTWNKREISSVYTRVSSFLRWIQNYIGDIVMQTAVSCGSGWTISPDKSSCIKIFNIPKKWEAASTYCHSFGSGSDLVLSLDSRENELLQTLIEKNSWIGLKRM